MWNIPLMGPIHKCDSHSPFITSEKKMITKEKEKTLLKERKSNKKTKNEYFILP